MESLKDRAILFWQMAGAVAAVVLAMWYMNIAGFMVAYQYSRTVWSLYLFPTMVALFQQNQFVQVVIFGSVSAYCYLVMSVLNRTFILPLFTGMQCSIVVHNTDPSFNAVIDYISDNLLNEIAGAQYSLQANTKQKENKTRKDWIQEWLRGDSGKPNEFIYRPDNDQVIHTLFYKGHKVYLERAKSPPLMGRDQPFTPESLKLSVWGNDNSILKDLLRDSLIAASEQIREGTISIFTLSSGWLGGWELALTKKARSKDSVILDMHDMDVLLSDARNFLRSGKWYADMGIPYRRGYLLYGPPGCGKTSFAQVLAGEMKLDLCILNLTHAGLTDDALAENLRDAPLNSIIVLEDVDALFVERTATKDGGDGKSGKSNTTVSFSGLLNALDGVASQEGRLLFMTTNHIEKLDPALIRPGRCDVQLEVKLASKNQMERLFLRFFPSEEVLAKQFAANLPANEISMATLQGYFLKCLESPQKCVEQTSELLQDSRPMPNKIKSVYDHLKRFGLEKYAAIFEHNGIATGQDLARFKVDDLVKLSVELKYDPQSQRLLEAFLGDKESFMKEEYALAEVSHIRQSFLAAYADMANEVLIKTVTAPLIRQHSNERIDSDGLCLDNEDHGNMFGHSDAAGDDDESVSSSDGSSSGPMDPAQLTAERLSDLSRKFCNALSSGGKGMISYYNLRQLLDSHPRRPVQCVQAAAAFMKPRAVEDRMVKEFDLYGFIKRMGLASKLHNFLNGEIEDLDTLLAMDSDAKAIFGNLKRQCRLDATSILRVTEIVCKQCSGTGNLVNFALPTRRRIMDIFELYYTVGESAFPGKSVGKPAEPEEEDKDEAAEKGDKDTADADAMKGSVSSGNLDSGVTSLSDTPAGSKAPTVSTTSAKVYPPAQLEKLAYRFSLLVTDAKGCGLVSMLEVIDHLHRHPGRAEEAIATALREAVNPPHPEPPVVEPTPPPPREWIDEWLEKAGSVGGVPLSKWVDVFKAQGFVHRADLKQGSALTLDECERVLGVNILSHRRKLVELHAKLLSEGDSP